MYQVLIVDDEEIVCRGMAQFVKWEKCGFEVAGIAASVDEALRMLKKMSIDVVFTDIRMPEKSGIDLLKEVQELYPDVKTVVLSNGKLVLFTAVSVIFIYFLYVQLIKLKVYDEGKCRVIIFCMGEKAELTGFVDTGNVLVDIYTKKPVSVVPRKYIQNILNKIDDYTKVKYHIIPFRSLGCENGMIEVISVESMYIYLGKKEMRVENALIGYTDMELSGDNEYEMLVNAGLLR